MFERFTESARQVVALADDEARTLGHPFIGTEHLLLGVLRQPHTPAAQALASAAVMVDEVRAQVVSISGQGARVSGQIPFSPRAKQALELGAGEPLWMSVSSGGHPVRPEDILRGLLLVADGRAARIVERLTEGSRDRLLKAIGHGAAAGRDMSFTKSATFALGFAEDEARALKHNYIGTEHVLLGLLREEQGLAAHVLESMGIRTATVRGQVARIVGQGDERTTGNITLTPRVRRVLERAQRKAHAQGLGAIDTHHILLGLMDEPEGVAAHVLLDAGIGAERVAKEIDGRLSGPEA